MLPKREDQMERSGGLGQRIPSRRTVAQEIGRVRQLAHRIASITVRERHGQGTTEYAILVGVIVVIAIVAVIAFRGKVQELWATITDGINSL